jgi:hypothetical protein
VTARNLGPPGKRRGGPHQEAAHNVADATIDRPIVTDTPVTTVDLARRWRQLRLGCPRGCPLHRHQSPCHLAAEVA